jgi:hypothetical protein
LTDVQKPTGNAVCPGTIDACNAVCGGGEVETNTCTNDSEYGGDNPFQDITYCYDCTCADGSSPDLSPYLNTVPNYYCQRDQQDCFYAYDMYGQLPPDGACPTCGEDYAPGLEPHYPWETTTAAAAEVTTFTTEAAVPTVVTSENFTSSPPAAEIPVTTETPFMSTGPSTSSTPSAPVATFTSLASEATTLEPSTALTLVATASTPLSSVSASQGSSSATTVPTSGARMVEPVLSWGMVVAAVFAL